MAESPFQERIQQHEVPERYKECGLELERRVSRLLVLLGLGLIIDGIPGKPRDSVGDNGVFYEGARSSRAVSCWSSSWHAKA